MIRSSSDRLECNANFTENRLPIHLMRQYGRTENVCHLNLDARRHAVACHDHLENCQLKLDRTIIWRCIQLQGSVFRR